MELLNVFKVLNFQRTYCVKNGIFYHEEPHSSYPENLTRHVKMSQLRNEPSHISKLTIWTVQQKKTLPLRPM